MDSSKCHLSSLMSTNSSGTDSKNISVERWIPASCIPNPADTLNCEGVKAPIVLVNGCFFRSVMSSAVNVLLFPAKDPSVLIFFVAIMKSFFIKLSPSVNTGITSL